MPRPVTSGAVLSTLCAAAAGLYLFGWLIAGALRLSYPYPYDGMEDAAVQMLRRITQGLPPYGAPSLEVVPLVYAPLYFELAALVADFTGAGLMPLRLVSLLASCVTCVLIYRLVERETTSRLMGVASAGLFAGSTELSGTVLDLARVDALAACLAMCAIYAMRTADLSLARASRMAAASGAFAALAICTKQTYGVVALTLLACAALAARSRLVAYTATLGVALALAIVILALQAGDWAQFYLYELPRYHVIDEQHLRGFWHAEILPRFALPLALGPLYLVGRFVRRDYQPFRFYGIVLVGLLGLGWAGWANRGGYPNVLLPTFAGLSILFGLGVNEGRTLLDSLTAGPGALRSYLLALFLAQFVIVAYNPRSTVPLRSDSWAGERLTQAIATLPGPVFAPRFGEWTRPAGKGDQPNLVAMAEILGEYSSTRTEVGAQWRDQAVRAIAERRYTYVLWDPAQEDYDLLWMIRGAGYVNMGSLFEPNDGFNQWKTGLTPDVDVYVAPERAASSGIPVASVRSR